MHVLTDLVFLKLAHLEKKNLETIWDLHLFYQPELTKTKENIDQLSTVDYLSTDLPINEIMNEYKQRADIYRCFQHVGAQLQKIILEFF